MKMEEWAEKFWKHAFNASIYPGFKCIPNQITAEWIKDAIYQCGYIFFESFERYPTIEERTVILNVLVSLRPDAEKILKDPVPKRLNPS
jgi:hypothetical protein